jgi:hypothetical protein
MAQSAIRPTVTQKVRRFLAAEGVEVKPWAGLDATYVELYRLMNRRRDDPAFWGPLAGLLRDVVDDVTDPASARRLPSPHAELLSGWEVHSLVGDLRKALPGGDAPAEATTVRRFGSKLPASVLGGFLLLGLAAAGCNDDPSDDTPQCTPVGATTWADGCGLAGSTVLWCSIATSSMEQTQKNYLCGCFNRLNTSWNEGLTALFSTESPEVVARALQDMFNCLCSDPVALDQPFPADPPPTLDELCTDIPVYKGVSFD